MTQQGMLGLLVMLTSQSECSSYEFKGEKLQGQKVYYWLNKAHPEVVIQALLYAINDTHYIIKVLYYRNHMPQLYMDNAIIPSKHSSDIVNYLSKA